MRRLRLPALAVLVALFVSLVTAPVNHVQAAYPGTNGLIALSSLRDGQGQLDLWTVTPDATTYTKLTESPYADVEAVWSPGGTQIAFTRYLDAQLRGDLWLVNADGSGLRQLTSGTADDYYPTWSPDGSRIAFGSDRDGDYDIYSIDPVTGSMGHVTNNAGFNDIEPAWSPDGTKIAFISDRDGQYELFTMSAAGGGVAQLTEESHPDSLQFNAFPSWSPDGTRITFTWGIFQSTIPDTYIHVVTSTGTELGAFTVPGAITNENSVYSPDGLAILFDSDALDDDPSGGLPWFDVYVVPYDYAGDGMDSRMERLTPGEGWGVYIDPDWQPIPAFPFVDARFSPFEPDIEWIYGAGITTGCSLERYCPDANVTRGQMAAFLVRALGLPSTSTDYFTDDETSIFEADINALRAAGITTGCSPSTFCPQANVTRGQMAAFLHRAFG